jgi:hypothetical protein
LLVVIQIVNYQIVALKFQKNNIFSLLIYIDNMSIENKVKKSNPWFEHVKKIREQNPDVIYKDILKMAKDSYHPPEKVKKPRKPKLDDQIDQDLLDLGEKDPAQRKFLADNYKNYLKYKNSQINNQPEEDY